MNTLIFDIETGPLPADELERIKPCFHAPANFRDPEKIAAAVAEKEQSWRDQAALSALSGQILAIGCLDLERGPQILQSDDEREIISDFWQLCREKIFREEGHALGFYIYGFDLPFLLRRSWRLRLTVPADLRHGRYWNHRFIDLHDLWSRLDNEPISLSRLGAYFGFAEQPGDGAHFATLWREDRPRALTELEHKLNLIARTAETMGVIPSKIKERGLINELLTLPLPEAATPPSFHKNLPPLAHFSE